MAAPNKGKDKGDNKVDVIKKDKGSKLDSAQPQKKFVEKEESNIILVRIAGYDIPGTKGLMTGLTRIKGVGWGIAKAACLKLGMDDKKKIGDLTKPEIQQIEQFLKNPSIPDFMKNRRKDVETGETKHYIGTDLEMKKDFDIRRMKKIRSYKGVRHTAGQPVRGQRTKSHFRSKKKATGATAGKRKEAAAKAK